MPSTLHILAFVALVSMVTAQDSPYTTPTPYAFKPRQSNQYNDVKETQFDIPEFNTLDADFPSEDDVPPVENVVYVEKTDYEDTPRQPSTSENIGKGEPFDPLSFDPERYSEFGGLGSEELYRLMALGPQQSDPAVGFRFGNLFNRMAPKMKSPVDNFDHCPERPEIGIQYYCMKLEDGLYFDPWNPWCGYIQCSDGVAERVCCKQGTWLGPIMMLGTVNKINQDELCRRPLQATITDAKCPMPNTKDLCKAAIQVEKMNPPKKKFDIPMNQFSQGELTHFTRLKAAVAPEPAPSPVAKSGIDPKENTKA